MRRTRTTSVPPRPIRPARRLALRPLWPSLTIESQERILLALSRIVAQRLATTSAVQEATHEPS